MSGAPLFLPALSPSLSRPPCIWRRRRWRGFNEVGEEGFRSEALSFSPPFSYGSGSEASSASPPPLALAPPPPPPLPLGLDLWDVVVARVSVSS